MLEDVLNDKVSLVAARKEYGVVLDTDPLAVDEARTAKAQDKLRRAVDPSRPPVVIRESTK